MNPAEHWRQSQHALSIPRHILDQAPASPYGFPVERFAQAANEALARRVASPSDRRGAEALPRGGAVLDVGCGGGAGSLPLAGRAGLLIGVDEHEGMLEAFRERASRIGVPSRTMVGRWPDVSPATPRADVVVCHHVLYNAPDLAPFVEALTTAARQRVVVEMTAVHPLAWTAPLWQALHGVDRAPGPSADDAVAVLHQLGLDVAVDRWSRPYPLAGSSPDEVVAFLRRRLCVGPERDGAIRDALSDTPPPQDHPVVTVFWAGRAVG